MGVNAIAFISALGLKKVDVLGFSIGGLIAQEITLQAPDLVRRLVLVGTGPRAGESMDTGTPEGKRYLWCRLYKSGRSLASRAVHAVGQQARPEGREFIKRFRLRSESRDPESERRKPRWRSAPQSANGAPSATAPGTI